MKLTVLLNTHDPKPGQEYPIVIRASHLKERKLYYTGFRCKKEEFVKGRVSKKHPDAPVINGAIEHKLSEVNQKISRSIIEGKQLSVKTLFEQRKTYLFGEYIESLRTHYLKKEQYIIYRKSARLITELKECFGRDVAFEEMDQAALRKLEEYMISNGNAPNTRYRKFKFYSSFFNKAIKEGKTTVLNPFLNYKIEQTKVYKEKLTLEEVKEIEELPLKGRYNDVRNLFLFSFYCKGMRFENCICLKKEDVKKDRIYFNIVKGNKPISVKITPKIRTILDQYKEVEGEFVFPFVGKRKKGLEGVKQLDSLNTIVTRAIKVILRAAEIDKKISFHNARHSTAFNLKKKGVHINDIKDILGHSRTAITEVYLATLDDEALDNSMDQLYT